MYRKILLLLVPIIIIGMVIYADPIKAAGLLSRADTSLLLAAFILSNVAIALRVLKWKVLLRRAPFAKLLPVQLFGMAASNFTPGKVGEPLKAVMLKAANKNPVSSTLPSIIWERIIDLSVLIAFSAIALIFFPLAGFLLAGTIALGVVIAALIALAVLLKLRKVGKFASKLPVLKRIDAKFLQIFYSARMKKSRITASLILTAMSWLLEGVILYFSLAALGILPPDPLTLAMIFSLATVIGVASMLPGGMGSTDIVLVLLLSVFGMGSPVAVTGVLLARLISIWYVNLLGGISFLYLSQKSETKLDLH